MSVCSVCGATTGDWVGGFVISSYEGTAEWYCTDCLNAAMADDRVVRCVVCGRLTVASICPNIGSTYICPRCTNDGYGFCESCNCVTDDLSESYLCPQCEDERRETEDDEEPEEEEEEEEEDRSCIHSYDYIPQLVFHCEEDEQLNLNPYLGFELEVDTPPGGAPDINRLAREVADDGIAWCKHDGSLNRGFEMVSHPMTLMFHKAIPWPCRLRHLQAEGLRSADCQTCSMHVHVNRSFLSNGKWLRIDDWVSENQSFVVKVAQRHSERYAKFHSDLGGCESLESVRRGSYRYVAVNFENADTIEFRIFRGTLVAATLFKNLEFADAVARFFKFESNYSLDNFFRFCQAQPRRYAELLQFFRERNIEGN